MYIAQFKQEYSHAILLMPPPPIQRFDQPILVQII